MALPNTYWQLNYIIFPSGAYIDTGIVPSNHFTEIKVNDTSYVDDKHWIGTNISGTSGNYYHFTEYSNKYYWGRNGSETSGGSWTSGIHTLKYNYGSNYQVILDSTTLGSGSAIASTSNILIGCRGGTANFTGYVYYCKITDKSTNTLVRDFIPAMRQSDGKVGLYDLSNDVFYANSGSGTLGYGGIVTDVENITFTDNPLNWNIGEDTELTANFKKLPSKKYIIGT